MIPTILQTSSPNFNARANGKSINLIILHYTGMPEADAARARLCDPTSQVSAHYIIERDGKIWQLVAESERAWHSGVSYWQNETDINSTSIGIELVNRGHQFGYQTFPPVQITSCVSLVQNIMQRHAIAPWGVLAHSDVAPQRKEDPGELFPWQDCAPHGVGFWPQAIPSAIQDPMPLAEIRTMLRAIGYECPLEGEYDLPLRRVLLAFQRHWLPHHLSGLADAPTSTMLHAVATTIRPIII
jgi:N-acetylmuramoyl-L-alanine amidase